MSITNSFETMVIFGKFGGKNDMTKQEYNKCEKLMDEAIRNGKKAREEFEEANKTEDRGTFELLRLQAQNHLGYAEGINQCLALFDFKHERMKELRELL